jgi:hypothetical protein
LRDDPAGYLAFIERRLAGGKFDVLLPTHEQGFLLARAKPRIEGRTGVALPSFANYRTATARQASAGCSIGWGCRSRRRKS